MKQKINLNKPSNVVVSLSANNENIHFVGKDEMNVFFNRERTITGTDEVNFYLPLFPKKLELEITGKFDFIKYEIKELKTYPIILDSKTIAFVNFITNFCIKTPKLKTGIYKFEGFQIEYLKRIPFANTPARIHKQKNYIQIDRNIWLKSTVPARVLILLHEYAHNNLNEDKDSEQEADENALNIFLALGYPRIEAINAFLRILNANKTNIERLENIYQTIDKFEQKWIN